MSCTAFITFIYPNSPYRVNQGLNCPSIFSFPVHGALFGFVFQGNMFIGLSQTSVDSCHLDSYNDFVGCEILKGVDFSHFLKVVGISRQVLGGAHMLWSRGAVSPGCAVGRHG